MSIFVIAGSKTCANCAHAIHVAQYLHSHLPKFRYNVRVFEEDAWQVWLAERNSDNKWAHMTSPLVWKEISRRGGKPYLIGGLSEFWEYCYDYYGFQSRIPKSDLEKIVADNLLLASKRASAEKKVVSILGGTVQLSELLVMELEHALRMKVDDDIIFKIYDEVLQDDIDVEYSLLEITTQMIPSLQSSPCNILILTTISEALQDCDLLLVITDYSRKPGELLNDWLTRCMNSMLFLADEVNRYAKRNLRLILSHPGPVCFNASVLIEYCTTIRLANIVAVTADEGFSSISMLADKTDDLIENFGCPPVWGFSGITSFVDIGNTVVKGEVIRPFQRSLKSKESSKLPKGEIRHELRLISQLLKVNEKLYDEIETRKEVQLKILEHPPQLAKLRATISLVKLWYADVTSDDIISLGVCSNGSFGFPPGINFSQAVMLNEKRIWEPLANFPITTNTNNRIHSNLLEVADILKKFGLGEKMDK